MRYFLDTYAIIEIIVGNPKYKKFLIGDLFTTIFNLYEMYYILLKDFNEDIAKRYFIQFRDILFLIKEDYIFLASEFKLQHKKRRLSYTDALGYVIALKNNMKFLTGDKEFKNFKNVEFAQRL